MHGLSAIAERLQGMGIGEEVDEYEEEHEHGNSGSEGEGEGEGEHETEQQRADRLAGQTRMEEERVLKSGYLYKKQEKRKVIILTIFRFPLGQGASRTLHMRAAGGGRVAGARQVQEGVSLSEIVQIPAMRRR